MNNQNFGYIYHLVFLLNWTTTIIESKRIFIQKLYNQQIVFQCHTPLQKNVHYKNIMKTLHKKNIGIKQIKSVVILNNTYILEFCVEYHKVPDHTMVYSITIPWVLILYEKLYLKFVKTVQRINRHGIDQRKNNRKIIFLAKNPLLEIKKQTKWSWRRLNYD